MQNLTYYFKCFLKVNLETFQLKHENVSSKSQVRMYSDQIVHNDFQKIYGGNHVASQCYCPTYIHINERWYARQIFLSYSKEDGMGNFPCMVKMRVNTIKSSLTNRQGLCWLSDSVQVLMSNTLVSSLRSREGPNSNWTTCRTPSDCWWWSVLFPRDLLFQRHLLDRFGLKYAK